MRWLAAMLVLASCAKSLEELEPFDCTREGLCPTGYSCVNDECYAARIDGPCQITGFTDPCTTLDTVGQTECLITDPDSGSGICVRYCAAGGCDSDHVCIVRGASLCLPAPAAGCSVGLTAKTLGDGTMACVPDRLPASGDACSETFMCGLGEGPASECIENTCVAPCVSGGCDLQDDQIARTCSSSGGTGCFIPCTSASPCPGALACSNGHCVAKESRPDGVHCTSDNECASGYCFNGMTTHDDPYRACARACDNGECTDEPGFSCASDGSYCVVDPN